LLNIEYLASKHIQYLAKKNKNLSILKVLVKAGV